MAEDYIPQAVRDLLRSRWQGQTAESVEHRAARVAEGDGRPSYYFPSEDSAPGGFTASEVRAAGGAGAFGPGWGPTPSGGVRVNEHAAHSLDAFLTEVCEAWERHRERLRRHVR